MNFQKFVAWEKVPTLLPVAGAQESTSSSSTTGSLQEEESESWQNTKDTESITDLALTRFTEIPYSVRNVLKNIDTAKLERAKKDISKKLHHIQVKVNGIFEHYRKVDAFDPELEKEYLRTSTWEEKSRQSNLLEEISVALEQSSFRRKELQMVLESLKSWSEMLKTIESQEKVITSQDWIEETEKHLLKSFHAIQANILKLIKMCYPLIQETKKRKKSGAKTGIFKAWRDKVAQQPQLAEPLAAEQMVEDETITFTLFHEVNEMILELVDLPVFSKGEVNAIKYIAEIVANLTKAFGLLTRQCRGLKIKLEAGALEGRKLDPHVTSLQRELRMIIEKKAVLEIEVQNAEERCKVLLTANEAMQRELSSANGRRASLSKSSLGRFLQEKTKSLVDVRRSASTTKSVKSFTKPTPTPSKVLVMETEESSDLEEIRKLKPEPEDSDTEDLVSILSRSQSQARQDSKSKKVMKSREQETSMDKDALSDKEPKEKVVESTKKLKGDKRDSTRRDSKSYGKTKLPKFQTATTKMIKERRLSQPFGANSEDSIRTVLSPQFSDETVHAPGVEADIKSPAKKLLPIASAAEAQPPSIQKDSQPSRRRPSIKHSMKSVVHAIRFQKRVKFLEALSAQGSSTAPEIATELPDGSPSQKQLIGTAEDTETRSQDASEMQEQQTGPKSILVTRTTDTRKRGTEKRKQAKIIRDLGTRLQEAAREKGGVIDEETIKELFEELAMSSEDSISEQKGRSLSVYKLATAKGIDEASSGQDTKLAVEEFQASVLACIEDKLEKLKKHPSDRLKRPKKSQPTDPQAQRLYQAIDRKVEECFSVMKQKYQSASRIKRMSSQGSEEEEKVIKSEYPFRTASLSSQEDLAHSLSSPEEGEPQQLAPEDHKLSEQERKVPEEWRDPRKQRGEKEGSAKHPHPKEEKPFHHPKEVGSSIQESQEKELGQAAFKTEMQVHSSPGAQQSLWYVHLQERLEWEKERLHAEQSRLQEERWRLDNEEQYLEHWQELFQTQQDQWSQQQRQKEEQESLWNTQLEQWQYLKNDHEEQQQYWWLQQHQHQERLSQLQEEFQSLQEQYEEHLLLQKEQTEEEGHWDQLQAQRQAQLKAWQEEDEERERQRSQWQQQLADHGRQLEAWQQEKEERELRYKQQQAKQQQQQQAEELLWQQRSQQQLQRWQRQVQWQQTQQQNRQIQQQKVLERQKQIENEQKNLVPELKTLMTGVQGEVQWQETRGALPITPESPTRKSELLPTARRDELFLATQKATLTSKLPPTAHRDEPFPATHKAGRLLTTPQLSPEPIKHLDSFDQESTLFPELFPRAPGFPTPGITEQRYSLNVEAQRKNLELLKEATQKAGLASDLYVKAKQTVTQALHSNVERLALLFQKYTAFSRLQEIRGSLIARLNAAKDDKNSATMQKLYSYLERLDTYQQKVLENLSLGQKNVENKRRRNIENMIALFYELRSSSKLQLSIPSPLRIKAAVTSKETQPMPHMGSVYLRPKAYRSPLFATKKPIAISAIVRDQGGEQMESLWKTSITELSIPLGPKTPVSLLWSQDYGFPDIPRLLEFDITSIRNKPLRDIKTRVQSIPRWKISEYNFMHL